MERSLYNPEVVPQGVIEVGGDPRRVLSMKGLMLLMCTLMGQGRGKALAVAVAVAKILAKHGKDQRSSENGWRGKRLRIESWRTQK